MSDAYQFENVGIEPAARQAILALAAALAFGSALAPDAHAQTPFSVTNCHSTSIMNDTAFGICRSNSGEDRVSPPLQNVNACLGAGGTVTGIDGTLTCVMASGPQPQSQPAAAAGIQIPNCRAVTVSAEGTVTAICRDAAGGERVSSLPNGSGCGPAGGMIAGVNGALACVAVGSVPQQPPPQARGGPQLQIANCRDVTVSPQGDVTAVCLHPSGAEHLSTLQSANTCTSLITNVNGQLTCNRGAQQPAWGAPQQQPQPNVAAIQIPNCRNIMVLPTGDLTALCLHPNGTEHVSTLQSANTCTSLITNVNGALSCQRGYAAPPWQAPQRF